MNNDIKDLQERLGDVIRNTCNTIGCNNCGLKWRDKEDKEECSATELQTKIMRIQYAAIE